MKMIEKNNGSFISYATVKLSFIRELIKKLGKFKIAPKNPSKCPL